MLIHYYMSQTLVIYMWDGSYLGGPAGEFDPYWDGCTDAPEGSTCFRVHSGSDWDKNSNYAGWGVFVPPEAEPRAGDEDKSFLAFADAVEKLAKLGFSGRDKRRILNALFPRQKEAVRRAVYNTEAEPSNGEGD